MKVKIHIKDPDAVYEAIEQAAKESVQQLAGLTDDERDMLLDGRRSLISTACDPWIECGEYLTVEIDTDAGTATVLKVNR